jgi:hypothetical protein
MGNVVSLASWPGHSSHVREVTSLSPFLLISQWQQADDVSDP